MKILDLRSDTVTQPTPQMREAIANAVVGDDVYGDDPTINELEHQAAQRLGKEAALFVSSGTMGNLLGVQSQTQRGDEVILGARSHIITHEVGHLAQICQCMGRTIDNADDRIYPEDIRKALRRMTSTNRRPRWYVWKMRCPTAQLCRLRLCSRIMQRQKRPD